jgi:predicted transcriptional regulator
LLIGKKNHWTSAQMSLFAHYLSRSSVMTEAQNDILALTTDIVSAHVGNNNVSTSDLPALIKSVYQALNATATPAEAMPAKAEPAVSIRSSVKHDYIVCLEDGAKLKMLKRYLRTNFDMSPEDYRAKWGLAKDYPMVAPAYAEQRRTLAKAIGLGRKKGETVAKAVAKPVKAAVKPVKKAATKVAAQVKEAAAA